MSKLHTEEGDVYVEKEGWGRRNAIPLATAILSLVIVVCTVAFTYGKLNSDMLAYHIELVKLQVQVAELDARVRSHHEDSNRHMDSDKWNLLHTQIADIKALLMQHMKK